MHPIAMPTDGRLDATIALRADPYRFISRTARRLRSDAFRTRFALRPLICVTGPAAAALFYDSGRFVRRGAAPEPLRATLFGKGAMQALDGEEHLARKALFLALMTPARVQDLVALFDAELAAASRAWAARPSVRLYDALHPVLARAVCRWAGVPLPHADVPRRTRQLVEPFDAAGAVGPGHFRSRRARHAAEAWLEALIDDVQAGRLRADPAGALHAVAAFRRPDGTALSPRIAAVELLNVLRPVVAVSVYLVFAAHALHVHPEVRQRLRTGDADYARAFVQEVRRFYPFFPAVVARVRDDFEWRGLAFPRGTRTMLDLYGTNHDARTWAAPELFRPERFLNRAEDPYDFVPQGGGDARTGHRCPGERTTVALLLAAADAFARRLEYSVPRQDLRIDFARLPALPRSGLVISRVRPMRAPAPDSLAQAVANAFGTDAAGAVARRASAAPEARGGDGGGDGGAAARDALQSLPAAARLDAARGRSGAAAAQSRP
jgi:fatty-acid peroxygenase